MINNYYFNEKNIKYNNCTLSVPDYYTAYQKTIVKKYYRINWNEKC